MPPSRPRNRPREQEGTEARANTQEEIAMRRLAIPFLSLLVLLTVGVLAAPAKAPFPGRNGKIAFTFTVDFGDWDVYAVNPDGSGLVNLTPGTPASRDDLPRWAPD